MDPEANPPLWCLSQAVSNLLKHPNEKKSTQTHEGHVDEKPLELEGLEKTLLFEGGDRCFGCLFFIFLVVLEQVVGPQTQEHAHCKVDPECRVVETRHPLVSVGLVKRDG